ncbi:hypothetical protein [Streptomyces sp. NBC_00576]|uniref:hypothetical protein n=1 Tax=Streptomyces sp. NBC_00576 TaxID=2903665 RepID=UPI002E80BADD|nr:hypothetical protein [Streptomyces sp. NBC_00576]WUB76558.1 hypothetical protein OG734_44570 [Streptomyces sp. NBC_00576]
MIGIQTDHYDDGKGLVGIDQATIFNVRATYVCAGGVQELEALGWMSGTAVRYTIPAGVTHPLHRGRRAASRNPPTAPARADTGGGWSWRTHPRADQGGGWGRPLNLQEAGDRCRKWGASPAVGFMEAS